MSHYLKENNFHEVFFFIIICIIANSCEKLIYGEYKILDYFQLDKKVNQNMYKVLDGDNLYSISKKKKGLFEKINRDK